MIVPKKRIVSNRWISIKLGKNVYHSLIWVSDSALNPILEINFTLYKFCMEVSIYKFYILLIYTYMCMYLHKYVCTMFLICVFVESSVSQAVFLSFCWSFVTSFIYHSFYVLKKIIFFFHFSHVIKTWLAYQLENCCSFYFAFIFCCYFIITLIVVGLVG